MALVTLSKFSSQKCCLIFYFIPQLKLPETGSYIFGATITFAAMQEDVWAKYMQKKTLIVGLPTPEKDRITDWALQIPSFERLF